MKRSAPDLRLAGAWPWEREFFWLAAHVLACKLQYAHGGELPGGGFYDPCSVLIGELSYGAEMHVVLQRGQREAAMVETQTASAVNTQAVNAPNTKALA